MVPGEYNIRIYRGSTFSLTVSATNSSLVAYDFTDYDDIRMQIRPPWVKGYRGAGVTAPSPLITLDLTDGIEVGSGDETIVITISAADTAALTFTEGVYELELIIDADPTGDPAIPDEIVHKILFGKVTVTGEVTV